MCVSPITIMLATRANPEGGRWAVADDGTAVWSTSVETACHECWQCRENAINDWVGRNIAESKTARGASALTLTYGRDELGNEDHVRAKVLTYSDIQKFIKRLRRRTKANPKGFPCSYFFVGEYGSAKGRAHWHGMIYWHGDVPDHPLRENFTNDFWPHGFQFWDEPSHEAIRYACKYIQKDIGAAERQGMLRMSKKPPLGTRYFQRLAEQAVEQGIALRSLEYSWPEVQRTYQGVLTPIKFQLGRDSASERNYVTHYLARWAKRYPGKRVPFSPFLDDWMDRQAREDLDRLKTLWAEEDFQAAMSAFDPEEAARERAKARRKPGPSNVRSIGDWWHHWLNDPAYDHEERELRDHLWRLSDGKAR